MSNKNTPYLEKYSITDLSPQITSFSDTAAIIKHLDLVISIDTSVVHLAGAMGKATINLLPYVNDWRWEENTDHSVWYPNMQLLRQHALNDWSRVVDQLKESLSEELKKN